MTPILDKIINESQTAFINGRNILEGVIILHEVIHEFKRIGRKGALFKIDFEKAYDKSGGTLFRSSWRGKGSLQNRFDKPCVLSRVARYASI
jgi:hypothetical protein